jgi:hypothetical protein
VFYFHGLIVLKVGSIFVSIAVCITIHVALCMKVETISKQIIGKFPISTKHRKFVEWYERLSPDAPILLPGKSPISVFLTSLLTFSIDLQQHPVSEGVSFPDYCEVVENYGDSMPFIITGHLATVDIFLYLDRVARLFNDYLPALMMQEICARTTVAHAVGMSEKAVIEDFMREAGLSEVADFDAIKKRNQRYRTARGVSNYNVFKGRRKSKV